jgi:hypothetical protein
MPNQIEILTIESLEILRTCLLTEKSPQIRRLEELKILYSLTTYKSHLQLDDSVSLILQSNETSVRDADRANSVNVRKALNGVRWQHLREEALWVSLCFGHFFDYATNRWGVPEDPNKVKVILRNHWFTAGSRSFWRDHAVSRLWWMGAYLEEYSELIQLDLSRLLFLDSDLLSNLLGRPSLLSSKSLACSLFELLDRHHFGGTENQPYERDKFRAFMKNIDLRCGAILVDALSRKELDGLVSSEFKKVYL